MRADKVGNETFLARIFQMVAEAHRSRAPIQKLADVVAGYFVPVVVLVAIVTFAVWAIVGPDPRLAHALIAAGKGATAGVLFKNAEAIEVMRKVDTLVVDKTGTLAEGKPTLVTVELAAGSDSSILLAAAALERGSEHALAAAVVAGAEARHLQLIDADQFESRTGKGVVGRVDGQDVALGNLALLNGLKLGPGAQKARAEALRADGQTVMFVVIGGRFAGLLGVAEPVKDSTPDAIRQLQADGLRIAMLTGDSRTTAEAVARTLGIDEVAAEVLPEQKAEAVKRFQQQGRVVAMAGDGINDAPDLAPSDVGIAMGTGTDVAMESADD